MSHTSITSISSQPVSTASPLSLRDSPPSLTFSEFSSEDSDQEMESSDNSQDVSTVMTKVLGNLDKIVEHLREQDENEAANRIAQDVLSMVTTFNNATAAWDLEKCQMTTKQKESAIAVPVSKPKVTPATTWASIAATSVGKDNPVVKFRPCDSIKQPITVEDKHFDEEDMRVVWVQPWRKNKPLRLITERLRHGAIFSMAYSDEHAAVCVIFQFASSARMLMEDNEQWIRENGECIFGREYKLLPGLPFPMTAELRRMEPTLNERRRLTFARSQFFANGMTEERFKKDIFHLIGEHNVEVVWLFNTGNATVVFSAVPIARMIRDIFRKRSRSFGPHKDLQVTFSHDPCERPMNLITQIPNGTTGARTRSETVSGRSVTSEQGRGRRPRHRRTKPDADGWQTVVKRR